VVAKSFKKELLSPSYASLLRFKLVFFISVTSVLIQGTTLSYVAKLLHVAVPEKVRRRMGVDMDILEIEKSENERNSN
jgi:NhaP-type Na+/H+ and K+/H+ antiporter